MKTGSKLFLFLFALAAPVSGQDAAAGQAAYAVCGACHGMAGEGNQALNSPAIAGQEAWYLVRQLNNFRGGVRGAHADDLIGSQMVPMAQALASEADVANVAAYVSSLAPAAVTDDQGGDAGAGQALYAVCAGCHGPDGSGMEAMNAPNLTLQQDWYVVRQLSNFKSGVRGSHADDMFGKQMAPMAQILADDAALKNVAAYISTLR